MLNVPLDVTTFLIGCFFWEEGLIINTQHWIPKYESFIKHYLHILFFYYLIIFPIFAADLKSRPGRGVTNLTVAVLY